MRRMSGFTLIELIVTIAIIAILARVSYPAYVDYVTRGKLSEATSNLAVMRVQIEQFFQDNRTYVAATVCGTPPAGKYFVFTCPTLTATAFTATATGIATAGMGGFTYTVNQANVQATTAAPTGWATSATCWVVRKGAAPGSCS